MANPKHDSRRPSRSRVVAFRVAEGDYERITAKAKTQGVAPSVFSRAVVLDEVQRAGKPMATTTVVDQAPLAVPARVSAALRTEVNRVGVNLNQVARLANKNGALVLGPNDDEVHVRETLEEVLSVLLEVRDALGGTVSPRIEKLASLLADGEAAAAVVKPAAKGRVKKGNEAVEEATEETQGESVVEESVEVETGPQEATQEPVEVTPAVDYESYEPEPSKVDPHLSDAMRRSFSDSLAADIAKMLGDGT